MMKRMVRLLVLSAVLASALAISAFAADFTHCADALHELGLFQGTESGYELDRAPSRVEAGVMLVRLLGAEEDALAAETYTAPFTDVPNWAKPYVQYLYDNGLVNGESETIYGTDNPCTAQHYATFLLRALGYSDGEGGDFAYADAMDFAREIGVVDMANCDEDNFLRDDVVAMSYTALSIAPKTGEADLLSKLAEEGAIQDTKGYDQLFADYRSYLAAAGSQSQEEKMSMAMDMTMSMSLAGVPYMDYAMNLDAAVDTDLEHMDQTRMAMTGAMEVTINPELAAQMGLSQEEAHTTSDLAYYYADGYYYVSMDGEKLRMPLSFEEVMSQTELLSTGTAGQSEPICLVKDLSITSSGGVDTYTITYAGGAMSGLVQSVMGAMPAETVDSADASMTLGDATAVVTVEDDSLTGMTISMTMEMTVENVPVSVSVEMAVSDISVGNSVTVTLPDDLDTYQDITAAQA